MKNYWYLVQRNYDGKMFAMYGNTNPKSSNGLTGVFALATNGYRFETPFGTVRNVSTADYNANFYSIIRKVETPNLDVHVIAD